MKKFFIVALLCAAFTMEAGVPWNKVPYYRYQFGLTLGMNKISAPLARIPGTHWGVFVRVNQHEIGFSRDHDGEFLKLWGEPTYYNRTGFYYALMQVYENYQWGPRLGFGIIEYNSEVTGDPQARKLETGIYAEPGISGNVNLRGNGLGVKFYLNLNRYVSFVGCTVYLQVGMAWNHQPAETKAKMGASPSFPSIMVN